MEVLGIKLLRTVLVVLVPFTIGRFLQKRRIISFTRYDLFIGILFFGTIMDLMLKRLEFETGILTLSVIGVSRLAFFWLDKKYFYGRRLLKNRSIEVYEERYIKMNKDLRKSDVQWANGSGKGETRGYKIKICNN